MIEPGATIGILGGGQLGKMIALSAAYMGYQTHIFCPDPKSPAFQVTPNHTIASYKDKEALLTFAKNVDIITYEFENIPSETISILKQETTVAPDYLPLSVCQNRQLEKQLFLELNIPTATHFLINSFQDLKKVALDVPAVLKSATMGYDGKGQVSILPGDNLEEKWSMLKSEKAILEHFIAFDREVSMIVARNGNGEAALFPLVENSHENGILRKTEAPANLDPEIEKKAQALATKLAEKLNLIGLLTVEFFLVGDQLLANEMAPRPHNSGHWSIEGCETSQYEQLIRAICGLPFGSTQLKKPICMHNLIGDEIEKWKEFYLDSNAKVHLYGKEESRPGRKMGHVCL